MLSGVCVGTNDLSAAGRFYDAVLATIGMDCVTTNDHERGYAGADGRVNFFVLTPYDHQKASFGNGTQVMFECENEKDVHAFYDAALKMGGRDEGAPGPRSYRPNYYGAYVRDLDGNKLHIAVRLKR